MAAFRFAEFAAFAALLFVTRFVARPHLAVQLDEECHVGGIAVDVLAHGVRFPLLVYPQNEYDNGAFFSGLLAALSFSLLGRRLLALKLVMHFISAAGAVAALRLLRGCLEEIGLTSRRVRWLAATALVIAIAVAPRLVTGCQMCTVGFGTSGEGSAINTLLLALYPRRLQQRSTAHTAMFWIVVGLAFYLNKGTLLVIPALAAAEIALASQARRHLAYALGGFVLGVLPEVVVGTQRRGLGWMTIVGRIARNAQGFPHAFLESVMTLADNRIELLAAWALALCVGVALLIRSWNAFRRAAATGFAGFAQGSPPYQGGARGGSAMARPQPPPSPLLGKEGAHWPAPVTLGLVVAANCVYVAVLSVMAQGTLDYYAVYDYPILAVLFAVMIAATYGYAAARWSDGIAARVGALAIVVTLVINRPDALARGFGPLAALWHNRAGAACSWRFAEGFAREHRYGLAPPGQSYEQHVIERCRSLSEPAQRVDCVGGMARDLSVHGLGTVAGVLPAGLEPAERHAFAYYYGIRRNGDMLPCNDFVDPDLQADCRAGVQMDCLFTSDFMMRVFSGRRIDRPRCAVPEPPVDTFWAAFRRDLLAGEPTIGQHPSSRFVSQDFPDCKPIIDACY